MTNEKKRSPGRPRDDDGQLRKLRPIRLKDDLWQFVISQAKLQSISASKYIEELIQMIQDHKQ